MIHLLRLRKRKRQNCRLLYTAPRISSSISLNEKSTNTPNWNNSTIQECKKYLALLYPIDTPNLPYSTKSSLFMYLSIPSYIGVVLQFHRAFIRNINLPNSDRQHYKEAYCVQEAEISFWIALFNPKICHWPFSQRLFFFWIISFTMGSCGPCSVVK